MRAHVPPWAAVVLATVLVVAVSALFLTAAIVMLYAGAPPYVVALAVAALGWAAYLIAQRVRQRRDRES